MADKIVKTIFETREIERVVNITQISSLFIYNFEKNYLGFNEVHKEYEFIYVAEGKEAVFEDNKQYELSKGQALLHKPYAVHTDRPLTNNSRIIAFSFLGAFKNIESLFDKVINLNDEQIYLLNEILNHGVKYFYICESQTFYSGREKERSHEIPYGSDQILKNKIELFLIDLLSNETEKAKNIEEPKEEYLIKKIYEILETQKSSKFSLESISNKLNYSKNYLCRYFKEKTNLTINEYFYKIKIEEAKKMLINTDESLKQISDTLSFTNVQYFSSIFRKYVGITPAIWRRNAKKYLYY